jgi:hypothetical protein
VRAAAERREGISMSLMLIARLGEARSGSNFSGKNHVADDVVVGGPLPRTCPVWCADRTVEFVERLWVYGLWGGDANLRDD